MYRRPPDTYFFLKELAEYSRLSLLKTKNAVTRGPIASPAWNVSFGHVGGLALLINWLTLVS